MGKIIVENEEMTITEKKTVSGGEHVIEKKNYIMRSVTTTEFKSTIYSYAEHESILISKTSRFNEEYYKIVLFNEQVAKAWAIIELSAELDIKVKRLGADGFIVIGESRRENVMSQVSFCKLKPSTKVEEIAINFTKLLEIRFLGNNTILINYEDKDGNGKVYHVLTAYNYEGKILKTYYEYCLGEGEDYAYMVENDEIKIFKN